MRRNLLAIALVTILLAPLTSAFGQAASWKQVPVPPLHSFKPRQPKRIQLSNGMVIFLQEDHELPLIDGTARIRGGSVNEPANKTGLVDIFSEVWRTGGTKTQTGDQLDDFLEVRAAKVETGPGPDSTTIGFSCLKGDLDDVFKAFVDVLQNPEFREDKIDIAKKGEEDNISRRNDDVSSISHREATRLAYGPDNPYARVAEFATVSAITRQDLVDWHAKYIHPNNIILGISGDFDSAEMETRLRSTFDSWPKGESFPPFPKDLQYKSAPAGIYLVSKEDVNQSNIRLVALGTTRDNPDYYALSVFNEAFGGGFSSRLFNDIRTKRGLAYGVGGGVGSNFGHPGTTQIAMGTKSQSTVEAIQALNEDIDQVSKEPFTDDDVKRAKEDILSAFVFRLDSPDKILGERMVYEYYGYPPDWLDKYEAEVNKVTAADVNRVAAKYLHKDQLAVLVVGNPKEFDKPLSSLGSVRDIDITIPPPEGAKQAQAEKATESNPEGKELAAKVVNAMGGESKFAGIKAVRTESTQVRKTPQGDFSMQMRATIVYPDRLRAEIQTPQGALTVVATPDSAFMAMGSMGSRSMPSEQKNETLEQIKRDPIFIAAHWKDPDVFFHAAGTEKIGDVEARIVDVNAAGAAIRWFVNPADGHIMKETYQTLGQSGPAQGETVMEDWKTISGLTLPLRRNNSQNGEQTSVVEYKSLEINPSVDPKLFEKPAENSSEKQ